MATYTGKKIKDTYKSILKLEDNEELTTSKKRVTDGLGNQTPLELSDSEVKASSQIEADGFKTPTGTSSDFLMADGTTLSNIDLSDYYTITESDGRFVNVSGDTMTGTLTVTDATTGIHVDSAGHSSVRIDRGSTSFDNNLLFLTAGALDFRIWQDGSSDYLYVRDETGGGGNMVTFRKGGNVGIGTTSPGSKLEVVGDTSSALLTLKSNNGGANDAFIRFYDEGVGSSYSVGLDSSDEKFKIAFDTDGDSLTTGTKLVVDTSGKVGIGTTSPSEKLNVSGNILATGTILGSNLSGTNTGDQDLSGYALADHNHDSDYVSVTGDTMTGTLTVPNLTIGSGNRIKFANNDYIRYDDANGNGRFHFDADGGTNNASVQAATFVGALSTTGISGSNYNITGVNQLSINDPGEGILFGGGANNVTLYAIDDSTDNKMNFAGASELQVNSSKVFHDGYHPNADKWTTARTLSLTGDVSGSVSWDGSANASLSVSVNNDSHTHTWATINGETANSVNGWGGLRHQTNDGYIDFGPANSGYAHIYTDRPKFYFNKALTVLGSSIINQNDIRSKIFYDVDDPSYYADFGSGQIVLGGTGRIQGIDTVSAGTDAANKDYVDNAIAGVPQGDITAVVAGTGLTGGGTSGSVTLNVAGGTYTPYNDIRSLGTQAFTNGSNPNITTAQVFSEIESDGGFDSYSSVFKTSWSYAGNYNLTDAGRFTETAGSSWITWTDNSSDSTRGNITALAIAPNTGGSAGKVFIYNNQGGSYNPGWREVWTNTSDGAGSGLDADLLDGQHASAFQLALTNPVTGTGTTNYLSKFTGSTALGNSIVYDNGTNVGIGTTSPEARLHVSNINVGVKSVYATAVIENTDAQLDLTSSSAGTWGSSLNLVEGNGTTNTNIWSIARTTSGGGNNLRFNFGTNNQHDNDTKMVITSGGNVGIGTTSPGANLHIAGGVTVLGQNKIDGSSDNLKIMSDYANASGLSTIEFSVDNSEKMRITNGGNVGIGTTSPDGKLHIATSGESKLDIEDTGGQQYRVFVRNSDKVFGIYDVSNPKTWFRYTGNATASSTKLSLLEGGGNVGIGTSSPGQMLDVAGVVECSYLHLNNASTLYFGPAYFGTRIKANCGGLLVQSGSTYQAVYASAFSVQSDYRLKSNVVPLDNAIDRLKQMSVHRFNWNDRLDEPKVDGFIAHELSEVIPEAVLGEKDATNEDGTPDYQGIDQSKIVPLLTAALQDAITKIEQLESRIQTLENND